MLALEIKRGGSVTLTTAAGERIVVYGDGKTNQKIAIDAPRSVAIVRNDANHKEPRE